MNPIAVIDLRGYHNIIYIMIKVLYFLLLFVCLLWIFHYVVVPIIENRLGDFEYEEHEEKEGFIWFIGIGIAIAVKKAMEAKKRREQEANERIKRMLREAQEAEDRLVNEWTKILLLDFNKHVHVPPHIRHRLTDAIFNAIKRKRLDDERKEKERFAKALKLIEKLIDLTKGLPRSKDQIRSIITSHEIKSIQQDKIVAAINEQLKRHPIDVQEVKTLLFMLREFNYKEYRKRGEAVTDLGSSTINVGAKRK